MRNQSVSGLSADGRNRVAGHRRSTFARNMGGILLAAFLHIFAGAVESQITVSPTSFAGNAGTKNITVSLTGNESQFRVNCSTKEGTAKRPEDFEGCEGSVNLVTAFGGRTVQVSVTIVDDMIFGLHGVSSWMRRGPPPTRNSVEPKRS